MPPNVKESACPCKRISECWTAASEFSGTRLGPGYAYDAAHDNPLHEATEFQTLEVRNGWIHARMPDKSEVWVPETACMTVK